MPASMMVPATLRRMASLARRAVSYVPLRDLAVRLQAGLYTVTAVDYAVAVREWVRGRMRLTGEREEMLKSPERMVDEINAWGWTYGDCDDASTLTAALLASVGFRVRFRAIGIRSAEPEHVVAEVMIGGVWYPLDSTAPVEVLTGQSSVTAEV